MLIGFKFVVDRQKNVAFSMNRHNLDHLIISIVYFTTTENAISLLISIVATNSDQTNLFQLICECHQCLFYQMIKLFLVKNCPKNQLNFCW